MEEMEEKLGAILGNPQMMEAIMSMAQSLNQQPPDPQEPPPKRPPSPQQQPSMPQLPLGAKEMEMIQHLMEFSKKTSLDREEQALLKALNPYLSDGRIGKLEKAMHAAKLARFATTALEQSQLQSLFGR